MKGKKSLFRKINSWCAKHTELGKFCRLAQRKQGFIHDNHTWNQFAKNLGCKNKLSKEYLAGIEFSNLNYKRYQQLKRAINEALRETPAVGAAIIAKTIVMMDAGCVDHQAIKKVLLEEAYLKTKLEKVILYENLKKMIRLELEAFKNHNQRKNKHMSNQIIKEAV